MIRDKWAKNEQLVNNVNDQLIDLKTATIKNEFLKNENLNKIVDIVEKILDFNKQQKSKGRPSDLARVAKVSDRPHIKILTPKQMLQRLQKALTQVKADNTSENLLNEIW